MIKPYKLAYLNLYTSNIENMLNYYSNIMGLTLVEEDKNGIKYLSCGLDYHNIILTPSDFNGVKSIGYQISKTETLDDIGKYLEKNQIEYSRKNNELPGVEDLIELQDPDRYTLQFFHSMKEFAPGFKNTGIVPLKLGHIALGSLKPKESVEFYKNLLNFDYTDSIGARATFLTCNKDHHVLNISDIKHATLHHIAFELNDSSHQYESHDLLAKNEIPILWGPTRHTAGHNIASYHHDPDLNLIELFIDMDIYHSDLGYFEARPWHEDLPQKPKKWEDNAAWKTRYETSILDSALKKLKQ